MCLLWNETSCFVAKMKISLSQRIFNCVLLMDQIISADNRILQEQLEKKVLLSHCRILIFFFTCFIAFFLAIVSVIIVYSLLLEQLQCTENNELHEKVRLLEQRQSSQKPSPSCSGNAVSEEYVDELKKKVQSQVIYLNPRPSCQIYYCRCSQICLINVCTGS